METWILVNIRMPKKMYILRLKITKFIVSLYLYWYKVIDSLQILKIYDGYILYLFLKYTLLHVKLILLTLGPSVNKLLKITKILYVWKTHYICNALNNMFSFVLPFLEKQICSIIWIIRRNDSRRYCREYMSKKII